MYYSARSHELKDTEALEEVRNNLKYCFLVVAVIKVVRVIAVPLVLVAVAVEAGQAMATDEEAGAVAVMKYRDTRIPVLTDLQKEAL
jgi:hypothetical protein